MTTSKTQAKQGSYHRSLRVALAEKGLSQTDLAKRLGVPTTTLSDWLRGTHPAPPSLVVNIEKTLRLKPGSLKGG